MLRKNERRRQHTLQTQAERRKLRENPPPPDIGKYSSMSMAARALGSIAFACTALLVFGGVLACFTSPGPGLSPVAAFLFAFALGVVGVGLTVLGHLIDLLLAIERNTRALHPDEDSAK